MQSKAHITLRVMQTLEGLKKMKEIFDEIPVAKVKEKVKKVQFVENVVLNYSEDPRVPFM